MSRVSKLQWLVATGLLCTAAIANAQSQARLQFWSDPGDSIGQGQVRDITFTPADDLFVAYTSDEIDGTPASVLFLLGNYFFLPSELNTFTALEFSTAGLGIGLQPGIFLDAQRASFAAAGHPGVDASFQHRGCNALDGAMNIHEAVFDHGQLEHFSVGFIQHCEHRPALFAGEFSYDRVPHAAPVPEPSTLASLALGLVTLLGMMRIRQKNGER